MISNYNLKTKCNYIFITQNSYFLVHKFFYNIFKKENNLLIFVKEEKRGISKKYREIISNFGILNFFLLCLNELLYFLKFFHCVNKLKIVKANEFNLNIRLEDILQEHAYRKIISIGCPCKINTEIGKKYNIEMINVHGGIIPYQVGRFSPIKSIKLGHKYIGATIHTLSNEYDEGNIISQDYIKPINRNLVINYENILRLSSRLLNEYLENRTYLIEEDIFKTLIKK